MTEKQIEKLIPLRDYATEHELVALERTVRRHAVAAGVALATAMSQVQERVRVDPTDGRYYVLLGPPWSNLVPAQAMPLDEGVPLLLGPHNPERLASEAEAATLLRNKRWAAKDPVERVVAELEHKGDKATVAAWRKIQAAIENAPAATTAPDWADLTPKPFALVAAKFPGHVAKVRLERGENIVTREELEAIAANDGGRAWLAAGQLRIVRELDEDPRPSPAPVPEPEAEAPIVDAEAARWQRIGEKTRRVFDQLAADRQALANAPHFGADTTDGAA